MTPRLVYHDVLDTVRTKNDRKSAGRQQMAVAELMLSVLVGEVPVLSQMQAFDSSVVLGSAAGPDGKAFCDLIAGGRMQVRLRGQRSLKDAAVTALRTEGYVFHAWPELQSGADAKQVAASLSGERTSLDPPLGWRADTLRMLDAAVREARDKVRPRRSR